MKHSCNITIISVLFVVLLVAFTFIYPNQQIRAAELIVKIVDEKNSGVIAKVYSGEFLLGWTTDSGKLKENTSGGAHYEIIARKNGYTEESKTVYLPLGGKESVTLQLEKKAPEENPTARFSFSPSNPEAGEVIMFDGRDSSTPDGYIDSWYWDFDGDGEVDEKGRIAWEKFRFPGERAISFTVLDNEGRKASVKRKIRIEKSDDQPKADFFYEPNSPEVGEVVRFDGRDSTASEGYIDNWRWDFDGDGEVEEKGRIVWNEFKSSGNKEVLLTVVDDQGRASTATEQIKVGTFNQTPNAKLEYTPIEPFANQEIVFNGAISVDKDGEVTDYYWVFGDGTNSSSENPTHPYDEPGTYEVELTVTDDEGATDSTTKKVTVQNRKSTASFTYSPKKPKAGQQVTFDATTSSSDPDGSIESFEWGLTGDGGTDKTGSKVSHTYDKEGIYEVQLTITDDYGDGASTTQQITVAKPQEETEIDEKHALVIGISNYKFPETFPNSGNLNYPARDAETFQQLLLNYTLGNFKDDKITLLVNEEATTQNITEAFSKLITEANEDDLVVIYYSGHGTQAHDYNGDEKYDNRDEYYVTYDTNLSTESKLLSSGLSDDQFGNWLKSISSNQIAVFLDSCYSGGATKSIKGTSLPGQKAIKNNTVFDDFDFEEGMVLFSASRENQVSWEAKEFGHGVFTHFLVKGLRVKADTDDDGTITGEELQNYLKPNVSEYVEENYPTKQVPLMKGGITTPLVQREGKLTGKVKYIKAAQKDKADKGEYVVINLGAKDEVKMNDHFKVVYAAKGVVIEKLHTKIKITDVAGPHRAVGKVLGSELTVEEGYKVRKVE